MSCTNINKNRNCHCNFNVKSFGTYDVSHIVIDGHNRTLLNWSEISIPEIVKVPPKKPDIEHLDQVYVDVSINNAKLIETPFAYKSYKRLSTTSEITLANSSINSATVDISGIIKNVKSILAIPNLPAIPEVTSLQLALNTVIDRNSALSALIKSSLAALSISCLPASTIITTLNELSVSIKHLAIDALNALIIALKALVVATSKIPIVSDAVATLTTSTIALIDSSLTLYNSSLTNIAKTIALIGNTDYFSLISNEEGTCLSGRKLIINGTLTQKIVYTGLVTEQSVHSTCNEIPFTAYIIPYAKFKDIPYEKNISVIDTSSTTECKTITINGFAYNKDKPILVDLCEEFCIDSYIEDIFAYALDCRTIFKNITLFLIAKPITICK